MISVFYRAKKKEQRSGRMVVEAAVGCLIMLTASCLFNKIPSTLEVNQIVTQQPSNENMQHLSILTFNTWLPPIWLPLNDRHKRIRRIPAEIIGSSADIVCLQEMFILSNKQLIVDQVETVYKTLPDGCQKSFLLFFKKDCRGGLLTLSKFPIISEEFFEYPVQGEMKFDEKNSGKGFLISLVQMPFSKIRVINTHLYAGRGEMDGYHRFRQGSYMADILKVKMGEEPMTTILSGDLNLTHPSLPSTGSSPYDDQLLDVLSGLGFVTDLKVVGTDYTYDAEKNRYAHVWYNRSEGRQRLDYIFIQTHDGIETMKSTIKFTKDLISDHFGVLMELTLKSTRE